MNQDPIGLLGGSNLYLFAPNIHNWIDPLGWEKDWVKYEEKIRKLYPTRSKRKYKRRDCEGVADGIANVNGKETAIEAKYINKWKNSAYNPESFFSKCIKKADVVAYDDLGTEAIRKLEIENLPVIVVIDKDGNNLYETAKEKWKK